MKKLIFSNSTLFSYPYNYSKVLFAKDVHWKPMTLTILDPFQISRQNFWYEKMIRSALALRIRKMSWSSGYEVCLSPGRSGFNSRPRKLFFFKWINLAGNLKWIQNSKGHRFSVNILGKENFSWAVKNSKTVDTLIHTLY